MRALQANPPLQLYVANGAYSRESCASLLQGRHFNFNFNFNFNGLQGRRPSRAAGLCEALVAASQGEGNTGLGLGWLEGLVRLLGWREAGSGEVRAVRRAVREPLEEPLEGGRLGRGDHGRGAGQHTAL